MTEILLASSHMNRTSNEIWRWSVVTLNSEMNRTVGFVMNQPVINIDHKQISTLYGLSRTLPRCNIYCGGPVNTEKATIIHSPDWQGEHTQVFTAEASITFSDEIVSDICDGRGPKHWKVMLGHSEWLDGQLDAEITRPGGWLVQEWDRLVWGQYKRKDKMWRRLIEQHSLRSSAQFLDDVLPLSSQ